MKEKKTSEKSKKLKKVSNTMWFAGTVVAVLFILVSLVITAVANYKTDAKDEILADLAKYNASKFGYVPDTESIKIDTGAIVASIPEDLTVVLDTIKAESVEILDSYTQVSVRIKEPVEDIDTVIDSIIDNTDYWQIVKEGVVYHGTKTTSTVAESDMPVIEVQSTDIDNFFSNYDDTIRNANEDLFLFYDMNYGYVPLTKTLCEDVLPLINGDDELGSLIIKLQLLSALGEYTPVLNDLYDLYSQIQ